MAKRRAFIVNGLFFGDEGKGTTVDHLVRKWSAHAVIRYNGGSQAGHNVVTPDGLHHCFAQFGSGTLVPGTLTYLSRFVFVDPLRLVFEYDVLVEKGISDALGRLIISKSCPVITPFHKFAGQMRELARGANRFGSCGMGVGEAMNDFAEVPGDCLTIGDLAKAGVVEKKLKRLQKSKITVAGNVLKTKRNDDIEKCFDEIRSDELLEMCRQSYSAFSDFPIEFDDGRLLRKILACPGTVVFEGAQGALLDRNFGFRPFVTKSDCTFANAEKLLVDFGGSVIRLGIMRAYATRHGNGPFVTEDASLTQELSDQHNVENTWQGKFRIGWLDLVALKYALGFLGKLDGIVLTNLDRIKNLNFVKVCTAYEVNKGPAPSSRPVYEVLKSNNLLGQLTRYLGKNASFPLVLISKGPTFLDKNDPADILAGV